MLNLIGTYDCKADSKGRVTLPASMKRQLVSSVESGFVLKRSVFQKCLELYPMSSWEAVMEKVNKLNRFVKKNNDFIRMFTAGVRVIEMDNNGRILIPKDLAGFAGISSDIVLSSNAGMIEVWDKDAYEAVINDPGVDFGALAEDVMGGIQDGTIS
jgi:MraZ protein